MINIINIDPSTLTLQNISPEDVSVIPNVIVTSSFSPVNSKIEYFIYDSNNSVKVVLMVSLNAFFANTCLTIGKLAIIR